MHFDSCWTWLIELYLFNWIARIQLHTIGLQMIYNYSYCGAFGCRVHYLTCVYLLFVINTCSMDFCILRTNYARDSTVEYGPTTNLAEWEKKPYVKWLSPIQNSIYGQYGQHVTEPDSAWNPINERSRQIVWSSSKLRFYALGHSLCDSRLQRYRFRTTILAARQI